MNLPATTKKLPVLATQNIVLYPGRTLPLAVGRKGSLNALEIADQTGGEVMLVAQKKQTEGDKIDEANLYKFGTIARIDRLIGSRSSGFQAVVTGTERVSFSHLETSDGTLYAHVFSVPDNESPETSHEEALIKNLKSKSIEILRMLPAEAHKIIDLIATIDDLNILTSLCAENLDIDIATQQSILEERSLTRRTMRVLELMDEKKLTISLQEEIRTKVTKQFTDSQREAILREQLRTIQAELGQKQDEEDLSIVDKIHAAELPEGAKKTALAESARLESMSAQSPEAHVIRSYLELICELPWNKSTPDNIDIAHAKQTLEEGHFGMEKVKKRIVQQLAVMKMRGTTKGSLMLLVGPPGVGKTSLGESIAAALGRKFVRVSLGGVRDDAEIRGHRRTYVGAMPGKIIQSIKSAEFNNPVIQLDEIDKLGRGYSGDPAAALLEVLDPAQNDKFTDHYLNIPFDLSQAIFIATANTLETIPRPLLDRMEVINLSAYTIGEKVQIAEKHLLPKILKDHGLAEDAIQISSEELEFIIQDYTRESGVRELERQLATLSRHAAEIFISDPSKQKLLIADRSVILEALGKPKYQFELAGHIMPPGVVTGLAWTPVGGEILLIEASKSPGSGKTTITGQLGDVMKESIQIALSVLKQFKPSILPNLKLTDLHVHVPAGATPKDGPSAGITMLTSLASLFSGVPVDPTIAMTGEITLRGAVMPVGGIKEKLIAAQRAGVKKVFLSHRNERDLDDLPEEVRDSLEIIPIKEAHEVLFHTLGLTQDKQHQPLEYEHYNCV